MGWNHPQYKELTDLTALYLSSFISAQVARPSSKDWQPCSRLKSSSAYSLAFSTVPNRQVPVVEKYSTKKKPGWWQKFMTTLEWLKKNTELVFWFFFEEIWDHDHDELVGQI